LFRSEEPNPGQQTVILPEKRSSLKIMAAQVRQSRSRDTLRLHKVLKMSIQLVHARLRAQPTRVEITKATTSNASTTSAAMKPALHCIQAAR